MSVLFAICTGTRRCCWFPLFNHDNTLFAMKTVKIGEYTVEIYDAIDELPMLRFHKYNKMLLVDAGIGSDLQDFDTHIEKGNGGYARSKTPELAAIELIICGKTCISFNPG